jgi:hypothetical protein
MASISEWSFLTLRRIGPRGAPSIAGEEIDAVELAITMRDRNVEYYKILVKVKEELGFDA